MRRLFLFSFILLFLVLVRVTHASPQITNLTLYPSSNLWIGENLTLLFKCFDNFTNISVKVEVKGPSISFESQDYKKLEDYYFSFKIPYYWIDKPGDYSATIYCTSNQTSTLQFNFYVWNFSVSIASLPKKIYEGDTVEIKVLTKKNDVIITKNVSFKLFSNGKELPILFKGFDLENQVWVVKTKMEETGDKEIKVVGFYDRTNAYDKKKVEVKKLLLLNASFDKQFVRGGDLLIISLLATYRDKPIDLKAEMVKVSIGNEILAFDMNKKGSSYLIQLKLPNFQPGKYKIKVEVEYENLKESWYGEVYYTVLVKGNIKDAEGNPIPGSILIRNTNSLIPITGTGSYSFSIPPGDYDLEFRLKDSRIVIYDTKVEEDFDNPLRFDLFRKNLIEGIRIANIYVIEFTLPFSFATLYLPYDESKILDERNLVVYRCEWWNFARRICTDEWEEMDCEVDRIRNLVIINVSNFSAFAIGEKKKIEADISLDKSVYYLGDAIRIKGFVHDEFNNPIKDAKVKVKLGFISKDFYTDRSGYFSGYLKAPETEGNYTLLISVSAEKSIGLEKEIEFQVIKKKSLSLRFPDSIKIKAGDSYAHFLQLVNDGQVDVQIEKIGLTGIPSQFYEFKGNVSRIRKGESVSLPVYFNVPSTSKPKIYTAKISVKTSIGNFEKTFAFSVLEGEEVTKKPTGFVARPSLKITFRLSREEKIGIIALAAICLAVLLIKKRRKKYESPFFFDLKEYFG